MSPKRKGAGEQPNVGWGGQKKTRTPKKSLTYFDLLELK